MYTNTWYMIANTAKTNSTYCAYLHPWKSTNESSFERFMLFELFFSKWAQGHQPWHFPILCGLKPKFWSYLPGKLNVNTGYAPVRTHMRTFSSSERKMSEWAEIQAKIAYEQKKCQLKIQVFIAIKESLDCRWIWQKHAHPPRSDETYCIVRIVCNITQYLTMFEPSSSYSSYMHALDKPISAQWALATASVSVLRPQACSSGDPGLPISVI